MIRFPYKDKNFAIVWYIILSNHTGASRALRLIIAKCKLIDDVPYNAFSKLYETVVWPVTNYSTPVLGFRSYSCIDTVHNRAMRFYLGVGKYTPHDAVAGEMSWQPPSVRQWKSVCSYFND